MAAARKQPNSLNIKQDDVQWIKDQLNSHSIILSKLQQTVIGDKDFGQKGLVEQVNEHRKYIENNDKLKSKFVGGSIVVGAIWTFMLKFWDKIFH
jgi:hypothetical protein